MKRNIALILLLFMFSACTTNHAVESTASDDVFFATEPAISVETTEVTYILNTNTKKIHDSACFAVDMIKDENKAVFQGDCTELIAQGYTLCKRCLH